MNAIEDSSTYRLSPGDPKTLRDRYEMLRLYREGRNFRDLRRILTAIPTPADYDLIRVFENPAAEAVLFHTAHVFPGSLAEALPVALPVDDAVRLASERVLRWSWFGTQKDRLVDVSATYGDAFLKSWSSETRVGFEVRHPRDVTEFEEDAEGNIVYLRLDVPLFVDGRQVTHTEVWSKEDDFFGRWIHELGPEVPLSELPQESDGDDEDSKTIIRRITDFGYDFVPFVRAPFGQGHAPSELSRGVFEDHREAIDDHARSATVLRDRYFRHGKPLWQSVTALDKPVDYVESLAREESEQTDPEDGRLPDREPFVRNPKGTRLEALVPSIDWSAGLAQIEDARLALERSMPELRFFRGHDKGDPSGAAMDRHQSPAIRRARAARGNYEEAIIKALKMCLTMGQSRGLFRDALFGTYESGAMDGLTFTPRPVVPETETERMASETQKAEMYAALKEVSPELLRLRLLEDGYEEEVATQIVQSTPQQSLAGIFGGANLT